MKKLIVLTVVSLIYSCTEKKDFDLQGHRGARGLMPENTIPAFIYALDQGVTTLELDLVVSGDSQLVVSHEPYMSAQICLDSLGQEFGDSIQYRYNIYQMTYNQIRQFDCGLKPHPRFPEQEKMPVAKPLLADVMDTVEAYLQKHGLMPISYNLEIKSYPEGDGIYHPAPAVFSDLVYRFIDGRMDWDRVNIQSFDFRVLRYFKEKYPEVKLAVLIENRLSPRQNIEVLGFKPGIYSPYFELLSQRSVDSLQNEGIRVIPWTVNEKEDMKQLVEWGVDGLITDYPNRYNDLKNE